MLKTYDFKGIKIDESSEINDLSIKHFSSEDLGITGLRANFGLFDEMGAQPRLRRFSLNPGFRPDGSASWSGKTDLIKANKMAENNQLAIENIQEDAKDGYTAFLVTVTDKPSK